MVNHDAPNDSLKHALELSVFSKLNHRTVKRLLSGAKTVVVLRREAFYTAYATSKLALLHTGQVRASTLSKDGRSAAVRYARPGQLVGLPAFILGPSPISAIAVQDCVATFFRPDRVRAIAKEAASVAWSLAIEMAQIGLESREVFESNLFEPIDQRVARHLMEFAVVKDDGSAFVNIDQATIADSIGSVREVTARALRRLETVGCIRRSRTGIEILSFIALRHVAERADSPGTDTHKI